MPVLVGNSNSNNTEQMTEMRDALGDDLALGN